MLDGIGSRLDVKPLRIITWLNPYAARVESGGCVYGGLQCKTQSWRTNRLERALERASASVMARERKWGGEIVQTEGCEVWIAEMICTAC